MPERAVKSLPVQSDLDREIDETLVAALRAALPLAPEAEVGIIADYMHGVADVVGVVLSMLVGRGLIEAECVEHCLRDAAETWREKGHHIRALAIERERAAIAKIGAMLVELKPLAGHVAGSA
jgi:hypothetical protein